MIDTEYATTMARYARWMNDKIYAAVADLDDAERRADRGAFFGSIHATLNHICHVDLAFLSRFTGNPDQPPAWGSELFADFESMRLARRALDERIESWAAGFERDWLAAPLTFTSQVDGRERTLARWIMVVQLFNHGTHHRGQVTTLLSQMEIDIGSTDLPYMPGVAEVAAG